jgi:fatty acid desaturase
MTLPRTTFPTDEVLARVAASPLSASDIVAGRIERPVETPVPNLLNTSLVLLSVAGWIGLLWAASRVGHPLAVLGVGIVFSYLFLTVYALLHEGSHGNLNSHPRLNTCLGMITGLIFGSPFSMIRVTHQGHHSRNRTDPEIFDLYTDTDSRLLKTAQWYGTLAGFFWPLIPISAVLISVCPGAVRSRLFTRPPLGNANLGDLGSRDVWGMRFELCVLAAVVAGLHVGFGLAWWHWLVLYGCASFNWSTRQYIGHAFTKRDIIDGALNLEHNWLMSRLLLFGEWDLTHHRRPEVPWIYLPRISSHDDPRPGYLAQYWRQWTGPRRTEEVEPSVSQPGEEMGVERHVVGTQ